ncbi:hypothetical protein CFHF_08325 [Caulobacter flavus]|uniref:Uncharacterized protein n=1 Tax=Caulobacter flavus TaxID=1679497 RepID=A0A2N5CVJ6_9CAUL|nr:hypothetical protein CFHF_08325 [Caulobacter flavus]
MRNSERRRTDQNPFENSSESKGESRSCFTPLCNDPPLGEVARRAGGGTFSASEAPKSHHQLPPPIAARSPPPRGEVPRS